MRVDRPIGPWTGRSVGPQVYSALNEPAEVKTNGRLMRTCASGRSVPKEERPDPGDSSADVPRTDGPPPRTDGPAEADPKPAPEQVNPLVANPKNYVPSTKDLMIIELRKAGRSYKEISEATGLSKPSVIRHCKDLVMYGYLTLAPDSEEEADGPKTGGPTVSANVVPARALGAATAAAAKNAMTLATEMMDITSALGQWAWTAFKEEAERLGYENPLDWLNDCVEYWRTERGGWQHVLTELHARREQVEEQRELIQRLRDLREARLDLMERVAYYNMIGAPFTNEQVNAMVLGIPTPTQPRALAAGGARG
jgi:hypothetical protein